MSKCIKNQIKIRNRVLLILNGLNFELNEVISPKEIAPYEVRGINFEIQKTTLKGLNHCLFNPFRVAARYHSFHRFHRRLFIVKVFQTFSADPI